MHPTNHHTLFPIGCLNISLPFPRWALHHRLVALPPVDRSHWDLCVCVWGGGGWEGRSRYIIISYRPLSKRPVCTSPLQTTPASLLWSAHHRVNEGNPGRGQSTSLDSDPLQLSWLRKMGPSPPPNTEPVRALTPGSSQERKNIT